MAQNSGLNAAFVNSQKDCRSMKSNPLAVFVVSLKWTDEVKVVSRGTARSRTSVTGYRIKWSTIHKGASGVIALVNHKYCERLNHISFFKIAVCMPNYEKLT